MSPQDRELFQALHRRQLELETSMARLKADLREFERRAGSELTPVAVPPPLPEMPVVEEVVAATPPPIPVFPASLPPIPEKAPTPENVSAPEREPAVSLEIRFFQLLPRIGVVLALITVISFSTWAYAHFHNYIGPWVKLAVLTLVSSGLIATGFRLERKNNDLVVYGRTLAGGGLACLYYTLYGATYVRQLHVISSPFFGGLLLLAWSACVLYLAERKKSELLSIFAIALAYFSSTITPVGEFTMVANLILALTAVIFLVRNAWTGLSYLCLVGTYAGYFRQIVEKDGFEPFDFRWMTDIHFWPSAIYLIGAWVIFTAGIFLARTPGFAEAKRMTFLCLNNGAVIGLLIIASQLSGYGHIGGILCWLGVAFLACFALARSMRSDATEIAGAYLMQGLALVTGGIVIVYTGVTRGLLITVESVFLAAAGAYSRNWIVRAAGCISALIGTGYLIVEIGFEGHYPWTLTLGGAAAMLANAWFARRDFWAEARDVSRTRFVWTSAFYDVLALALLVTGIVMQRDDDWIAPGLAFAVLGLTFAVYLVPLFELPPLSQLLLVLAQVVAFGPPLVADPQFFPQSTWGADIVAAITMLLVTWWPRQKLVRTGYWLQPLIIIYALAMVAFGYNAIHPHVSAQTWMICASLLSLLFLAYGALNRTWQFILSGQIFLGLSVYTFLEPAGSFPWTWWAAAVPPATVFVTAWLARGWLPRFATTEPGREILRVVGYVYQSIAVGLLIFWVYGVVPADEVTFTLFLLGTIVMLWNLLRPSAYGVRTSFVLSAVGAINCLASTHGEAFLPFTWINTFGFLLLLSQPAMLRRLGRDLVSEAESWAVVLISSAISWYYISAPIIMTTNSQSLTLAWALFALALIVVGFAANERRQRWCGLGILGAAIIRVAVHDFWLFSDGDKVLTFFVLTVICLGLSFLYYKFANRLKEWL